MTLPERTMIVTTKRDLSAAFYWCAILILIWAMQLPVKAQSRVDGKEAGQVWAAVAPGVVEPRSGQIKIAASVVGRVSEVLVKINDKVATDEPLLRLDDEDAQRRVTKSPPGKQPTAVMPRTPWPMPKRRWWTHVTRSTKPSTPSEAAAVLTRLLPPRAPHGCARRTI